MGIEPIGLVILALGFACLLLRVSVSIFALSLTTLLGASAAVILGSSGQIQPAHLLLMFVVPCVFSRRAALIEALQSIMFPQAGFWLLFVVAFGVVDAILLPRVFAGATAINAIGQSETGTSITLSPLAPVGGNTTQTIYVIADLACFLTIVGAKALPNGIRTVSKALVAFAVFNIIFALLDIITFYTGTAYLLDPIRNARYTTHFEEITSGLKRIAGSFTETSSFSTATLGALGFTGTLCIQGRWSSLTGFLAVSSIALLVLSTSSTAIVAGPFVLAILYASALGRIARGGRSGIAATFVIGAPVMMLCLVGYLAFSSSAASAVGDYLNVLLFDKASSQSGVERASWNAAALQNIIDTYGLGAGLGSVRASSFVVAVPANLGIPGVVLFIGFFWQTLARAGAGAGRDADFSIAARNGCLGLLTAAILSGALVDLGLQFFLLAGLASARRSIVMDDSRQTSPLTTSVRQAGFPESVA